MSLFETLKMYCEIPGPGSREERVHGRALENWKPYARETWRSPVGNAFAHIGGDGPKMLLLGHGDEIGFALKYISLKMVSCISRPDSANCLAILNGAACTLCQPGNRR